MQTYCSTSYIYEVFMLDKNRGWACGSGGLLLKTNNGGVGSIITPKSPQLINPENGMSYIETPVEFYWEKVDYSLYRIQISFNRLFNNMVLDSLLIDNRFVMQLNEYTDYYWRIRAENIISHSVWSEIRKFATGMLTNINEIANLKIFSLSPNYPNPFNPTTSIQYAVGDRQFVSLKVYDVLGREVATLVNEEKKPGTYEVKFDGSDLSCGIYFYRIQAGSFVQTRKMILIK